MRNRYLLPALLVVLALTARLVPGPRTIDDAYITFRYARNLLAGNGFVYNPGERVQGTTTPLYTLLMAGLGALSGGTQAPFPALALGVNALADSGTALLLLWLGRRLGRPRAGLAAGLAWAAAPFSVTFAIGGLETSLYVFLLTGCAAAYAARWRVVMVLCAVLALLTRPDALILLGPLAVDRLVRAARPKEAADRLHWGEFAALLPALGWFLFATLYFGSPVAHSVQAKMAAYRLTPDAALIRLIQHYATPFMENNWLGTAASITIGILLYPFLYAIGARRAYRREPRLLALLLYPWLYFAVFAVLNPLIFRWYLTPPLPAYFLFLLIGAEELLCALSLRRKPVTGELALTKMTISGLPALAPVLLLVCLPLLSLMSDWRLHPDPTANRPAPDMAFIQLEQLYRQAAARIAPELDSDKTLAAGDVGVLGFYTPAKILDTVGLNSPVSMHYYPLDASYYTINYAVAPDLILDQQPDFMIILEVYAREGLLKDVRFQQQYRLVETLPTDLYGSRGMLIYQKSHN
jgi:arabinofuranosyltransferase